MFRRRSKHADESPDATYRGLRTQALSVTAVTLGEAALGHPDVLGAVVDIPSGDGMASVVAMADGSTSMYTSASGGTIGAGTHEGVAERSHALLATLQGEIDMFPSDDRMDLPHDDLVQITIITPGGRRRASIPAAAFWGAGAQQRGRHHRRHPGRDHRHPPGSVADMISKVSPVSSLLHAC